MKRKRPTEEYWPLTEYALILQGRILSTPSLGVKENPMRIDVWTDGSCSPNPGKGGWAAVLISGTNRKEISGALPETTNIRAEITAFIEAMKVIKGGPHNIVVHTDSDYVRLAIEGMKRPKANFDLMREADLLKRQHTVTVEWIKGHAGETNNERCDQLARLARA